MDLSLPSLTMKARARREMNETRDQKPGLFLEKNIAKLGRTPFIRNSVIDIKEKEKANETMSEDKTRDLDQQVLGTFEKSYRRRYERWKRQDLLSVALQTFPKQVKKEKVTENLTCLKAEFEKKLR